MWILVVEALTALGLLLFIVWWTLGPTQRRERAAWLAETHAKSAVVEPRDGTKSDAMMSRDATSAAASSRDATSTAVDRRS